ncbi:MAG: hypothetical protein IJ688_13130 [Treponema sp.]|nr:hypothetical protein [Treponema sp.]
MDEITKEKINLEISKIDTLVSKSSLLLTKCKNTEPDFFDLNAAGSRPFTANSAFLSENFCKNHQDE